MTVTVEQPLELADESISDAIESAFKTLAAHRLSQKQCPSCKKILPLVPAAFRPDPKQPDGYSELCAVCDIEEQRRMVETCIAEANLAVNVGLHRRAIEMASRATGQDGVVPHLKVLYQRQMEAFGGAEGIAAAKAATYLASKEGSMQRVRILDGVDHLGVKVTEIGSADLNVESMTQEELTEARRKIEGQLQQQLAAKNLIETTAERIA